MLNASVAVFRLTTHQLLGGRRRWLTIVSFALPVLLAVLARALLPRGAFADPTIGYATIMVGVYAGVFVPFMALYWGSAVLTDEIDGKTLVYLWTRPAGRARLMTVKFLVAMTWFVALLVPSAMATYLVLASGSEMPLRIRDLLTVVWDVRALSLGALAYGAFAFFLSAILKKPLMASLLYVYLVDFFLSWPVIPGYLKMLSIHHYVAVLGTQQAVDGDSRISKALQAMVADTPTTEGQAVWTLIGVGLVFVLVGAWLMRSREFLGDDPARNQ